MFVSFLRSVVIATSQYYIIWKISLNTALLEAKHSLDVFRVVEWWIEALNKDGFQLSMKHHDVHVIGARLCRLCKGRLSCHSRLIVIIL